MNSVRALIYKDRNRRIGARVRNMLSHFLHDEGIANDQAKQRGKLATRFFAHNRAVVELHKQHQARFAQAFLDCTSQLGKRACFVSRPPEISHIWVTDSSAYASQHLVKRLGRGEAEPLNLDFSYHLTSPTVGNLSSEENQESSCGPRPSVRDFVHKELSPGGCGRHWRLGGRPRRLRMRSRRS